MTGIQYYAAKKNRCRKTRKYKEGIEIKPNIEKGSRSLSILTNLILL